MKHTAPPPPDMSREQARELKQLRAREDRLNKTVNRSIVLMSRRINRIDAEINRNRDRLFRELGAKQKEFCKPLRAEQRQLRSALRRANAGHTPERRELTAVSKRIAILEGRLGA